MYGPYEILTVEEIRSVGGIFHHGTKDPMSTPSTLSVGKWSGPSVGTSHSSGPHGARSR